jgi:hypothetical protein
MKKLIAIAALAALCACADNDAAEDEAVAEETAAPAPAETVSSMAGTYEFELDGVPTVSVLNADGTYADTQNGEVTETGTWAERDGKTCFDPMGDDTPETCFTTTEPDAEGVFTATADDGTVLTITRTS